MPCESCASPSAAIIRPKDRSRLCKGCFISAFEDEVHQTILSTGMLRGVRRLILGVSGGKDSTVLAHVLNILNARHKYGVELCLLCIDEGIAGYRDKSIEVVKRNESDLGIKLTLLSYSELFGHTMDSIVGKTGTKGNCTYCGVFRRSALEEGAGMLQGDMIATGHNADDVAETVVMNYLRGDIARLRRCAMAVSERSESSERITVPRCKPLMYAYEKEIVMYAFYNKLPYFSTECKYSPHAFRGNARTFIKGLEKVDPKIILNLIRGAQALEASGRPDARSPSIRRCLRCGHACSSAQGICKGCTLLEGLPAE